MTQTNHVIPAQAETRRPQASESVLRRRCATFDATLLGSRLRGNDNALVLLRGNPDRGS